MKHNNKYKHPKNVQKANNNVTFGWFGLSVNEHRNWSSNINIAITVTIVILLLILY